MGASSLTNHLSSGPLGGHQMVSSSLSNSMSVSSASSAAVDALVSSFTQNSNLSTGVDGGIDLTALTQNSRANIDLTSLAQSRQNMPLDMNSLSQSRQSVPMSMNSQTDSLSSSQQRPKPQRSKLPPPSKVINYVNSSHLFEGKWIFPIIKLRSLYLRFGIRLVFLVTYG